MNRVAKPPIQLLLSLALALIAVALYSPTLGADFVYDARFYLLGNDYVHHLRNLFDVITLHVMTLDVIDNNRPVYVAYAILNWALWGANPAGHHFASILLHAAATVLLFRLCCNLLDDKSPWPPFLAALLFAVHPLNCEAVAEVSYSKDLLVTVFILAALNLATAFRPGGSRKNILIGIACVICLLLAVGTKENGAAGPAVLICYWLFFRHKETKVGWLILTGAACVTVGAFLVARFTLPPKDSLVFMIKPPYLGGSLGEAVLIQPSIWTFYLRQIIWPQNLCGSYSQYSIRNFNALACIAIMLVVICLQLFAARKNRLFAFGTLFFWMAILPVSNLVPMYRPIADRFLYLPMAGVTLLLLSAAYVKNIRKTTAAIAVVAICAFSVFTFRREQVWHDSLALWSDSAKKNIEEPEVMYGLGISLYHKGMVQESLAAYDRGIELSQGDWPILFAGKALSLNALGRTKEAEAALKHAEELDHLFAYPELLTKAFILEKADAEKLKNVSSRDN